MNLGIIRARVYFGQLWGIIGINPGLSIVPSLSFWQYTGGLTSTTLLSLTVLLLVIQLKMSIFALLCNLVIFSYLYARPFFQKLDDSLLIFWHTAIYCAPHPLSQRQPLPFRPAPSDIPIMRPAQYQSTLMEKSPFQRQMEILKNGSSHLQTKNNHNTKKIIIVKKKKLLFCFLRTFNLRPPVILLILLTKKISPFSVTMNFVFTKK